MGCKESWVLYIRGQEEIKFGPLAHFGRASVLQAEGDEFETRGVHQIYGRLNCRTLPFRDGSMEGVDTLPVEPKKFMGTRIIW